MKIFPYRSREGEIPLGVLKVRKVSALLECQQEIAEQQRAKRWSAQTIQNIFEHYCYENKAAPFQIAPLYNYDDPSNTKLSLRG